MTMGPTEIRAAELLLLARAKYLQGLEEVAFDLARRADELLAGDGRDMARRSATSAPNFEDWSLAKYRSKKGRKRS